MSWKQEIIHPHLTSTQMKLILQDSEQQLQNGFLRDGHHLGIRRERVRNLHQFYKYEIPFMLNKYVQYYYYNPKFLICLYDVPTTMSHHYKLEDGCFEHTWSGISPRPPLRDGENRWEIGARTGIFDVSTTDDSKETSSEQRIPSSILIDILDLEKTNNLSTSILNSTYGYEYVGVKSMLV